MQRWDGRTGERLGPPFGDRPAAGRIVGAYVGGRDDTTLVESIAVSPDGRIVATRHDTNGVGLWDPVSHVSLAPEGTVLTGTVSFAPHSGLVFIGGCVYHLDGPR
ncbi:hypothetical protein [Virgisporangium ochraceum]|uniref:Uncharacterized protein n=1 Tax=Virgisporangium ochraceum TaxID=65505 RepID=A0A8J4EAY6_9ACTN|nr:hypothetical protein [Virgisporangium ochraceum]GIJ67903.1 hypothetical protein Voc01_028200 [Virgisporangium ochraceum]